MSAGLVKGWCPGALRPMESGDGLIVRLKLTGGIVPLDLARAIGDWSARWGNGQIDLTSRGNLQIRGLTVEALQPLQDAMAEAGLLDISREAEAVRNVIASPLAGLDPDALVDIRPIVTELEKRLASDTRLHALPAKFCWLVDDGGRLSLGDVRADTRFEAKIIEGKAAFAIYDDGVDDRQVGTCEVEEVSAAAALLGPIFLALCKESGLGIRRMRDLTTTRVGRRVSRKDLYDPRRPPNPSVCDAVLGVHDLGDGQSFPMAAFLGAGLPFGRISATRLLSLVHDAEPAGAGEFRLTPWRTVLIPLPSHAAAEVLSKAIDPISFILTSDDPRLRVAACVGAPACSHATTDVRADASRLAPRVKPSERLHVSGCAKGCAHPHAANATLVARDGRYDLIRNGAPWDTPERTGLSPADLAHGLIEGQA
jgi:precorrin-3B synthase